MIIDNKKLLIGAGVLVVGYLLYKKSKSNLVKSDVPFQNNIDVNTIPDEFTIKSDGYNTTYQRGFMDGGNKGLIYWKKPYKLNSDSGVQPINIEVDEFKKAYNEFLKQPKF